MISRDVIYNPNPLFTGCKPGKNEFGLRLFHPMEQASLNRKTIINQIIEISRPPVLNSYNF